jgi:hypothetical protein
MLLSVKGRGFCPIAGCRITKKYNAYKFITTIEEATP